MERVTRDMVLVKLGLLIAGALALALGLGSGCAIDRPMIRVEVSRETVYGREVVMIDVVEDPCPEEDDYCHRLAMGAP